MLELFFGDDYHNEHDARALVDAYNRQSQFFLLIKNSEDLDVEETATQQIPAAFRFGISNQKIDALPSNPETIDKVVADDLFEELRLKAKFLQERLLRSNSDQYASFAADRLCAALVNSFNDVRPGVLLSRLRTIESIRDGYDNAEGRELILPDAFALMDDVCLSGQDLLATFPVVRHIERERLALGLERSPEVIAAVQAETRFIQTAAADNGIVTEGAVRALAENDTDIEHTTDPGTKAELVADTLLITRNFVSEAVRAVATSSKSGILGVWDIVRPDLEEGAKNAARILPPLAVIGLLTAIAGPIAGIAGLLRGDIFRSVSSAVAKVKAVKENSEVK